MVSFFSWIKKHKRFLLPLLGIAAFLLYIMLFNIDLATLFATASQMNILLFIAALLVGVASIYFFTLSWKVLISFQKIDVPSRKLFLFVLYGFYMDIIVPAGAVTGDIVRIYLVERERKGSETKTLASVITQRLLGMVLNVLTIVLGIALIIVGAQLNATIVYYVASIGGIISLGLIFIIVLIAQKEWSIRIIDYLLSSFDTITKKRWNVVKFREKINEAMERFRNAMTTFEHSPRILASSMVYLVLNWVSTFSVSYLIFLALGYPVSFYVIIITASIVAAIRAIPVGIPFEVGIPEITMTTLFIALGVPAGISATATILTRIITLWFIFALGFIAQQWIEIKPKFPYTKN